MGIKFSLQLKLLVAVALVVIITLSGLTYLSVNNQRELFRASFRDLGVTLALALDAGIGSQAELKDINKLQSNIYKIMWLHSDITRISINLPAEDGLRVAASNDTALIGSTAVPESLLSYQEGLILADTISEPDGTRVLRVITPVHVAGQRVGTYDIRLSLKSLEEVISKTQREFLLATAIAILVIITILFLLIKMTVISPVKDLQKGMEVIGAGDLDYRIEVKRKDEIGELAFGFNEMAGRLREKTAALEREKVSLEEKVGQRTKELEEAKQVLEIKVRARTRELRELAKSLEEKVKQRTKELEEKIDELKRFQKLAVGRELKMMELKEEIERLKRDQKERKE